MGTILIYVTHPSMDSARKIGTFLLEKKLIVCANYINSTSSYEWEGEIKHKEEVISLFKASSEKWESVRQEVERMHPFDCPCILKIDVDANEQFAKWIEK